MTRSSDGFVIAVVLALVTLGLGVSVLMASARTRVEHIDLSRWPTVTTVCCPAGTGGSSGGLVP